MSTKYKPGDQVRFTQTSINDWKDHHNFWWHGYPFNEMSTFTIIRHNGYHWEVSFMGEKYVIAEEDLEPTGPRLTQVELIIQKIKYLDNRYKDRKHATV